MDKQELNIDRCCFPLLRLHGSGLAWVVNLALFFGWHVVMPAEAAGPDWLALCIGLIAAGLLFGRGWTVLQTLLLGAAAGLLLGVSGLLS